MQGGHTMGRDWDRSILSAVELAWGVCRCQKL